ncbi:MAG: hypothetical protein KIS83_14805 [Rubrivivax sp.]|nr:hypothetical protein [Rubrivivax sp.]MCW5611924.1 hypothetical protein [Rubrivivax sp.]
MNPSRAVSTPSRWRHAESAARAVSRALAARLAAVALLLAAAPAAAQGMCPGEPLCRQVPKFSATITEFRVSPNTLGNRPVQVAVRFTNRTDQPLILGYVDRSAAAFDDRGNKYALQNSAKLTGIGRIERQRFDPKFTLGPGESADARMELNFFVNRNVIVGTGFDLEMSVREIEPLPGNQYRLGREHALSWQHLANGAAGRAPAAAAASPARATAPGAPAAPPTAAAPAGDACAGVANCTASGPVAARIVGVASAAPKGNNHEVTVRIAFQNLGSEPMILNYKQDTGVMLDERGEKYIVDWRYRESVQGMPVATRDKASSQFTLQPGESRTAAFVFRRFVGKVPAGTLFAPTLAVEQYVLLPSNQLQRVREYSLGFGEVRGGADLRQLGEAVKGLGNLLRGKH